MKEEEFVKNPPKPRIARDIDEVRAALGPWFMGKLRGTKKFEFTDFVIPAGNSFSSEIILLTAKWQASHGEQGEKFVVRAATTETPYFLNADFHRDYKIAEALYAGKSVPVPKPYWFEPNTDILGAPFCVMEQKAGRAATDNPPYNVAGWLAEASAAERASIWWSGVEAMARLHKMDWEAAGLGFLRNSSTPQGELEKDLDYYASFYDWACEGRCMDIIDRATMWLRAHLPEVGRLGFCWGDARMGNILFHNQKCNAMLDWEMATLGEPEKDLAYWIFFDRFNKEGTGAPQRDGWPSHEETLVRYEQLLGRPLRNLHFYEVFSMYRVSICLMRLIYLSAKVVQLGDTDEILKNHYFLTSLSSAIND